MTCELCGKKASPVTVVIEGTEFSVCSDCSKFGKAVQKPVFEKRIAAKTAEKEAMQLITPDYAARIRHAREKKGLTQKDFAQLISEKESLVHNMETGKHEPGIDLARKLEKMLGIVIVEQHEETAGGNSKAGREGLTIGDFVKFRK